MKAYLEIDMPKNCNGCPLHFYEGQGICSCCVLPTIEDDEILKPWKNRRKDCPLKAVPEHGRLIDANKIGLTNFEIILCQKGNPFKNALEMLLEKIENAPTVIQADDKDIKVPTREEEV